jgi:hypothetical protein
VPEQQRAVAHDVADELVAVDIPFARPVGPRDGQRKRLGQAHVVGDPARQQAAGPLMQGRRRGVLRGPPAHDVAGRRRLTRVARLLSSHAAAPCWRRSAGNGVME